MADLQQFTDGDWETEVTGSDVPVLADFWATWCMPCHAVAPIVEELAGDYAGKIKVGKLNVDENPMSAAKYGIRSIPTVLLLKNGEVLGKVVGAVGKDKFVEMINDNI